MRNIYYIQDIAGPSQLARFQEATPVNSHEISVTALYFALDNFEIPVGHMICSGLKPSPEWNGAMGSIL